MQGFLCVVFAAFSPCFAVWQTMSKGLVLIALFTAAVVPWRWENYHAVGSFFCCRNTIVAIISTTWGPVEVALEPNRLLRCKRIDDLYSV